ncbi:nucleotidyltransferase domain-containing protein [Rhodobacter lacus]|uniref:nucleotidyltransferase domain-containing protein n=1 Tax=Rhodobacter lacus TaxID=1641972 RepID=UPI00366B3BA9
MSYLDERRAFSEKNFTALKALLENIEERLAGNACVYATGSYGRLEAGSQSDLDLFIVAKVEKKRDGTQVSLLSNLDQILIKADLINAVRALNLPDFDGDGKYLACHPICDFVSHLGGPEDDYRNTLTGRLLMFLEGRPLAGDKVFDELIEEIIAAYFQDYPDHSDSFIPAFLCNDILRLWRTFCVNYEFSRKKRTVSAKSGIKNLKLKHSRMLTCYSAIIYMLNAFSVNGTVVTSDILDMVKLSPLQRIDSVAENARSGDLRTIRDDLSSGYASFLQKMDKPQEELIKDFETHGSDWTKKSYEFGDNMSRFINQMEPDEKFMRLLLI